MTTQPQGPSAPVGGQVCQSCAMPLQKDEDFGTEADGSKSEKLCRYYYQSGQFADPDITMEKMIELSAKGWSEQDPTVGYEQAVEQLRQIIPSLERWRK